MPSTKPSSPQLDERRRERGEAALDIAVAALRRIERLGSAAELTRKALAQIETLVPEQGQRRWASRVSPISPFRAAQSPECRRGDNHRIPRKARPDYLPAHGGWLVDLKTAASANPRSWRDQAYRLGYHARAAWYLDGAATVLGRAPEEYWFVVVEKEPPYLVSVISFDEEALEWGRIANRKACALFARSAAANDWPGYREPGQNHERAFRVGLPPWAILQLQDRAELGEFSPGALPASASLRAAERFFSTNP